MLDGLEKIAGYHVTDAFCIMVILGTALALGWKIFA